MSCRFCSLSTVIYRCAASRCRRRWQGRGRAPAQFLCGEKGFEYLFTGHRVHPVPVSETHQRITQLSRTEGSHESRSMLTTSVSMTASLPSAWRPGHSDQVEGSGRSGTCRHLQYPTEVKRGEVYVLREQPLQQLLRRRIASLRSSAARGDGCCLLKVRRLRVRSQPFRRRKDLIDVRQNGLAFPSSFAR